MAGLLTHRYSNSAVVPQIQIKTGRDKSLAGIKLRSGSVNRKPSLASM